MNRFGDCYLKFTEKINMFQYKKKIQTHNVLWQHSRTVL